MVPILYIIFLFLCCTASVVYTWVVKCTSVLATSYSLSFVHNLRSNVLHLSFWHTHETFPTWTYCSHNPQFIYSIVEIYPVLYFMHRSRDGELQTSNDFRQLGRLEVWSLVVHTKRIAIHLYLRRQLIVTPSSSSLHFRSITFRFPHSLPPKYLWFAIFSVYLTRTPLLIRQKNLQT